MGEGMLLPLFISDKLSLYSDIFYVEVHLPLIHFDVHSCVLVEINFANKTS